MDWYLIAVKKYAELTGRARRKEYWMFVLVNWLFSCAATLVGATLGIHGLGFLYAIAAFLPGLTATTRRLHDTNRSGWTALVLLIPIFGAVVLLVFLVQDGTPGDNRFGPSPKSPAPLMATA
jgi:uncharacterized membrane protein YhaH (DUF805 family)